MSEYSYDQVVQALKNADKAGDVEAAKKLARIANDMHLKQSGEVEPGPVDPFNLGIESKISGLKRDAQGLSQLAAKIGGRRGVEGAEPPDQDLMANFKQDVAKSLMSRPTSVAAGGMAGAAIGAPLGPLGMLAGGALGAATGSAGFDAARSAKAMVQGRPEDVVPPMQQLETMGREAATDLGFGMFGALAQPVKWSRALLAKMSGVTTAASKAMQTAAKDFGIGLGAVDVGGMLPKAYAKTIGVFPWVGTPLRRAQISKLGEVEKAVNNTLNAFGPNYATSHGIGIDMYEAARNTRTEFRRTAASLYDNFAESVKVASRQDIIPTESARKYATEMAEEMRKGNILLQNGEPLPVAVRQETIDYLTSLQNLPELITPDQYRRLTSQELPDLISKHINDGADIRQLTGMKGALEDDFSKIRFDLLQEGEGTAIKSALDAANTFYAKGMLQFQTKAAKGFERVDSKIFKAGAPKPGSLNADELYNVVINLKSPQQIKDATQLVGRENIRKAASYHFGTAVEASTSAIELVGKEYSFVDPQQLERSLGLVGASKQKVEGIRELYKTAGVDFDGVVKLIDVMKKVEGIGNPAEFVRRRAVLSGVAGLSAAAGVGGASMVGGAPGGMVTGAAMTVLGRHFSKIFSDPRKLKQLTIAMDEAANNALRMSNLGRLTKAVLDEEEGK